MDIDVRIATGNAKSADGGIPDGAVLRRYANAILTDEVDLEAARRACIHAIGESATIQAATIVAVFDGINRVADATGIRLDPSTSNGIGAGITEELGMQELAAARS
ncbi:MAG: hypothetical protein GY937_24325 [bacterium]|nr:hypothetical protein [bacterium]